MGFFDRPRGKPLVPGSPGTLGQVKPRPVSVKPIASGHSIWLRAEEFVFHAISFGFAGVSAFAIWQIFVSRHGGDLGRNIEGIVIAVCFGLAGYFLSRNIAYRWMSGQLVIAYIPVCLVVELVEIYCNYVVGVSYLDLGEFFQTIPVDQHSLLLTIGRVVVSSIPAMTLFLAVAQMDLERRKLDVSRSKPSSVGGYQGVQAGQRSPSPQLVSRPQPAQPPRGASNGANPSPGVQVIQ